MKRRTVIGLAAGAVAVLVVAGGVAAWVVTRSESAEDAAGRYLAALSAGDVATIESFLPPSVDALDAEQIRAAFTGADGYIGAYTFTLADAGDGRQDVEAEVELGGEQRTLDFALHTDGSGWQLASDYLGTLEVSTSLGDSVRVGGVLTGLSVQLLPAVYSIDAAPADILIGESTVAVTSPGTTESSIDASLSPDATQLAQDQLDDYAATCAAATEAVPDNCGLRVPWAADLVTLDSIAFRVDAPPVLALADDGRSFAATGGVIVATTSGTDASGAAASFTYRADDWALRGSVEFSGDEMTLLVG